MTVYIACMRNDPFEHIIALSESARGLARTLGIRENGVAEGIWEQEHGLHKSRYLFEKVEFEETFESPDFTPIPGGIRMICKYCGKPFWQERTKHRAREYCMIHNNVNDKQKAMYRLKKQKERGIQND